MPAEFKIARLRFNYLGQWAVDTFYNRDAIVTHLGKTYVCLEPHTSGSTPDSFYDALRYVTPGGRVDPYWEIVIEGNTWVGPWATNTFYSLGNIVFYGGSLYICTTEHTSGLVISPSDFSVYASFTNWHPSWSTSHAYGVGDVVKYGGIVYVCNNNHVSAASSTAGLEANQSSWTVVYTGFDYKHDWTQNTRYKLNDLVKQGPDLYIATEWHSSTTGFDETKWALWLPGTDYINTWSALSVYQVGDVIKYGGYSYVSNVPNNTNKVPSTNPTEWALLTVGYKIVGDWSLTTNYKVGDVVRRGGMVYSAVQDNLANDPTTLILNVTYESTGSSGTTLKVSNTTGLIPGLLAIGKEFTQGQSIVKIVDGTTIELDQAPDRTLVDGQMVTFNGINYIYWDLVVPGREWRSFWSTNTAYSVGDIVLWKDGTYRCITTHSSNSNNRPDLDVDNIVWVNLSLHARNNALTYQGDIVTYSTGSSTSLSIGSTDQVLRSTSTNGELLPAWKQIMVTPKVYYVATTGEDRPDYGLTWDRPWKTIKYACEYVNKGTMFSNARDALIANKEFLLAEMYSWMTYQKATSTAPFSPGSTYDQDKTLRDAGYVIDAIVYDLSRVGNSQTVIAALAYFEQENNQAFINTAVAAQMPYFIASLTQLKTLVVDNVLAGAVPSSYYQDLVGIDPENVVAMEIGFSAGFESANMAADLFDIILTALTNKNTDAIPSSNNGISSTIMIKTGTYSEELPIIVPEQVALVGDELRGVVVKPSLVIDTFANLTIADTDTIRVYSTEGMYDNCPIQFVKQSGFITNLVGFENNINAGTTYYIVPGSIVNNTIQISEVVDGTPLALEGGNGFMQIVGGNAIGDMFHVRNASGLRNLTLTGLLGTLSAQNQYLTRRPTGGAYVALDPGVGPNDTVTWIKKRSPYCQNVTMFGIGCTAMKIDGTLHNGGYKSMTANDFTCIISDGIGAWVKGSDSKAELISVFTYYSYTGYMSEDGGRIRAANGNCSYGVFGAVAEGYDINETPITGTVDNRHSNASASVQQSYGLDANLLKLQYSNAGQGYNRSTTNLLNYSNNFIESSWTTDGNVTLQKNLISPSTYNDGWTLSGTTSNTDSAYIYQNVTIAPTGATYNNLTGSNKTGSGSGAQFNVTVNATSYSVVVSPGFGGTGYVFGNEITIYGSQVGGIDGVNDITVTVASLTGSTIITVTATGTVPAGSALPYTMSIYAKKGSAPSFDIYAIYSGTSTKTSYINFNFATKAITTGTNVDGGHVPTEYGVDSLTNDWYRVWFSTYDANALNTTLQFRVYPRSRLGTAGTTAFYGAQLEIGSEPSFYLTTSTGHYTSYADYIISGAGSGALIVADEVRAGSVYQSRITDPGSGAGGAGYLTASNNAQGGNTQYITLAQSDINTAANYNGMKMFINSGTGAGQYGFISNFNPNSKIAYVLKESVTPLNITNSDAVTDQFTLNAGSDVNSLYVNQPVQFIPTYYGTTVNATSQESTTVTGITGGLINTMSISDTSRLYYNMAVSFTGNVTGGVVSNYIYYVSEIVDETTFRISSVPYGNTLPLNTTTPASMFIVLPSNTSYLSTSSTSNMAVNMPIQFTGTSLGGISLGEIYYINDVLDSNTFTISQILTSLTVTATSSVNNSLTVSSTSTLVPLNPIVFAEPIIGGTNINAGAKYYISKIVNNSSFKIASTILTLNISRTQFGTNLITCNSTVGLVVDQPIRFVGNSFGGLSSETTYYILAVNDDTTFTIAASVGASAVNLQNATGYMVAKTCPDAVTVTTDSGSMGLQTTTAKLSLSSASGTMNAIFSTPIFGGINAGFTYYIKTITPGVLGAPDKFTISDTLGGSTVNLSTSSGAMQMGEVGWDHVNPGTVIEENLDSTSLYYIEPRLTYSAPPFSQSATTLPTAGAGTSYNCIAYGSGLWIASTNGNNTVSVSTDGNSWNSYTLPTTAATWAGLAYGNKSWVLISTGSKVMQSFSNGQSWKTGTMPATGGTWKAVTYGAGNFVAISTSSSVAAYSTTYGATWSSASLPASASWTSVAYGNNKFIAVASGTATGAYSTNGGATWTSTTLPGGSSDWSGVAYGNGRFVAVASTSRKPVYTFDGITWYTSNYSVQADYITYGNGVFLALKSGSSTAYTSEDGIFWKIRTVTSDSYGAVAFGLTASSSAGFFVTVAGTTVGSKISTGATTKGRPIVTSGVITAVTEYETGGGYSNTFPPNISIFDPNVTTVASVISRIGNGVLSAPTFINRGSGYNTSSTVITINGAGYADDYQTGLGIVVNNLTQLPRPGDDLTITGDTEIYKVTSATILDGTTAPNLTARIEISPAMSIAKSPEHATDIIVREKYSQIRLTNHDFLNVGYGDQPESGYPGMPTETSLQSQNQTIENNYGRVFYTSTDQDGNFKVGNLFGVEQATGIVTLSASQFGLSGLTQLSLGGIAVGGSSVVVTQFSTDPTFIANSDKIIPTQKAIKSYLSSRLSQGGSNTFTGNTTAGQVSIGGPNIINNTIPQGNPGSSVQMVNMVLIDGVNGGAIDGQLMAYDYFMKSATKR